MGAEIRNIFLKTIKKLKMEKKKELEEEQFFYFTINF